MTDEDVTDEDDVENVVEDVISFDDGDDYDYDDDYGYDNNNKQAGSNIVGSLFRFCDFTQCTTNNQMAKARAFSSPDDASPRAVAPSRRRPANSGSLVPGKNCSLSPWGGRPIYIDSSTP